MFEACVWFRKDLNAGRLLEAEQSRCGMTVVVKSTEVKDIQVPAVNGKSPEVMTSLVENAEIYRPATAVSTCFDFSIEKVFKPFTENVFIIISIISIIDARLW